MNPNVCGLWLHKSQLTAPDGIFPKGRYRLSRDAFLVDEVSRLQGVMFTVFISKEYSEKNAL